VSIKSKDFVNLEILAKGLKFDLPFLDKNGSKYESDDVNILVQNGVVKVNSASKKLALEVKEKGVSVKTQDLNLVVFDDNESSNQAQSTQVELSAKNGDIILQDLNKTLPFTSFSAEKKGKSTSLNGLAKQGRLGYFNDEKSINLDATDISGEFINDLFGIKSFEGGKFRLKMLGEMILNVSNIKWSNNDKIYNYIDLTSVDMQNHQIGNLSNISKEKHPSRAQQIVKFNDIIFATTRPMQKRIAMIPKYLDGQICSTGYCVLRVDEKIALSSWVYYVLCTSIFYDYVDKFKQGTSYPSISDNIVKKFKIPIPSLQTQRKVVDILDKFDTLVNSITEGLPREIELRRKQYEHYRELLLNFKPKMTA